MKASGKHGLSIGRCTDVGRVRAANEDSMGDVPISEGHVLIVADGMGGYRGGALASHLAVEAIEEYFRDAMVDFPQKSLRQAIYLANERIYLRGQQDEELSRMGSTCVLALVRKGELYIAHVGDSRIYLLRKDGSFQQLTRDHTVVQHFVDVGLLSQEEAEDHPDSHILSRALGPRAHVEPEVREAPLKLEIGDRIILCSDGLTKMLNQANIEKFSALEIDVQQVAEKLVEVANDNGGEDNVTVLIFEYSPDGQVEVGQSTTAKDDEPSGDETKPARDIDPMGDTPPIAMPAPKLEEKDEAAADSSEEGEASGAVEGEASDKKNAASETAEEKEASEDEDTEEKEASEGDETEEKEASEGDETEEAAEVAEKAEAAEGAEASEAGTEEKASSDAASGQGADGQDATKEEAKAQAATGDAQDAESGAASEVTEPQKEEAVSTQEPNDEDAKTEGAENNATPEVSK